jgi:uncharacterized delta-60 repeat protein
MRIQVALLILILTPVVIRAADADLDRTFGSHGWTQLDPSPHRDGGSKVALQSDGKIVLAAWKNASGGGNWVVARFTSIGALDPSFGTWGVVDSLRNGYAGDAAVQADGKILVCGLDYGIGPSPTSAVARYESDGTFDSSFGAGGIATVDVASGVTDYEQPTALAVQGDGRIVVVGYHYDNALPPYHVAIEIFRLMPDGSLDASFGAGGIAPVSFAESAWAFDVALQPDGKIVVAGFIEAPYANFLVMRLDANGALDPSFGSGGVVIDNPGGPVGSQLALAVDVLSDGKIIAGGYQSGAATVVRYLTNGSPDGAFGVGGVATATSPDGELISVNDMARRPDGSIVLVGSVTRTVDPSLEDMVVVRFDAGGTPDTAFAPNGVARIVIGTETSVAAGAIAQPDGKIVVTGRRNDLGGAVPPTQDVRILMARIGNTCGENGVDPGEECDDGNDVDGDCCSACRFDSSGSTCGTPDANPCTFDACDGAGTCVTNQMLPAGSSCGASTNPCLPDVCDGAGTCISEALPAGTPCGDTDGSPCTLDNCDGAGTCIVNQPWPPSACLAPTIPLRSSLLLVDKADDTRDKLTWKWTRGPEVSDFGSPDTMTGYRLCLFSGSALLAENVVPTGFGWTGSSKGWKLSRAQAGVGIAKAKLIYGGYGRSRITLQGRGPLLDLPSLPLTTPVSAQLISTTGACFSATYTAPSTNIVGKFRAKGS